MCGLYGSVGFAPDPARIDLVAHRGPDGRGFDVYDSPAGPVALGHRRLAIIDVSDAGLQPMADPTGACHLVFNGEIYNYIELRAELMAQGEVFTSQSDSEVLLRAYMVWGEACLPRLRGMFAFLIWDARHRRLFAARDRYGIKPLYMAGDALTGGKGLAFASEIKQLIGLAGVSGRMNMPRVHDFLASGISDHTEETMFDGVRQLRGGECVTVETASGRPVASVRRWYPVGAGDLHISEGEAAERFHDLLAQSVRLHLRSDVPVGSCLSGGLDSSAIVCLMAGLMPAGEKVNTISACYAEKSVDEKPFMEAVVAHAGTQPHYIFPRAEEVFARAADITWHQDEPFGSTSIFAQWCVFAEARRIGVKVMLDGQGADEQLAGYHSGFPFYLSQLTRQGRLIQVVKTMLERRELHGAPLPEQIKRYLVPLLPGFLAAPLRRRHQALTQENWLGTELLATRGNPDGPMAVATRTLGLEAPTDLKSLCLAMTFASNLQMLLHWEDRNSMAHAIEARVPFLDHPLVEFSLALGNDHKIVGGDTKRVLRKAMADVLPESVRERRDKLGFATPEQVWFRGPLRGLIHDGVEATLARYPDLLNAVGVRALRDDMLEGRRPVDFTLWRIANLGLWGERFGVGL
jgi:asparagine synthase (glutamine-hydrolysing)